MNTNPPANTPLAIPGLAEAIEKEKTARDADFLNVSTSIGSFEVVPMTLRHLCLLRVMRSPFIAGGIPKPADVAAFLMVMSPEFKMSASNRQRRAFLRRCRHFMPLPVPWLHTPRAMRRYHRRSQIHIERAAKIIDACRQFVRDTFEEVPPRPATVGFKPDYYSSAVSFCAALGREYGWSQSEVLNMPLRLVFQYNNEIREYRDPKAVMFNPSDRIAAQWLAEKNRKN